MQAIGTSVRIFSGCRTRRSSGTSRWSPNFEDGQDAEIRRLKAQLARAQETWGDNEALYQAIKARLIEEAQDDPTVLALVLNRPELQVRIQRQFIEISEDSTRGMVAKLMAE